MKRIVLAVALSLTALSAHADYCKGVPSHYENDIWVESHLAKVIPVGHYGAGGNYVITQIGEAGDVICNCNPDGDDGYALANPRVCFDGGTTGPTGK